MNTLKAEKRSMSDKAKKLRREGYVTGNVFGRSIAESIPVQIEKKEAEKFLSVCGKGSEAQLSLEGQQYDVLVKEVDYDPIKRQTLEIDFQVLTEGEKVRSVAEIVLVNHELVQGVLEQHMEEIPYKAGKSALVEKVSVDVGNLKPGDSIKVEDLDIAKDKDVSISPDVLEKVVVSVTEQTYAEADADDTEAAADDADAADTEEASDDTTEASDDDQKAADEVGALIDKIYVQERTDTTDEDCKAAKEAWDKLTDAQKELVTGEEASPEYFGRDTGDASKDDPRNQDEIGENELLVVSFGHPSTTAVQRISKESRMPLQKHIRTGQ